MDENILINKKELDNKIIKYENYICSLQIIIVLCLILCMLLLYLNCSKSPLKSISPDNREDVDEDILFLNEQFYYNSLCKKNKKKYNKLDPNEKMNCIKTNLLYKTLWN